MWPNRVTNCARATQGYTPVSPCRVTHYDRVDNPAPKNQ